MERRDFLLGVAGVSAGSVAGCVGHPDAILVFDEVNDELADRASNDAENVLDDIDGTDVAPKLLGNGTYTRTGRWEEIDTSTPVVYEGKYYSLTVQTSPASPDVVYDITAEYVGDSENDNGTAYGQLPEADRDALSFLTTAEPSGGDYENSTEYMYEAGADDESVIASSETVVVVEGSRFSVKAVKSNEIDRREFRYTAEEIASSQEGFVSWLKDEHLFVLDGLSDDERAVVKQAIEDGYYENSPGEAFESVVRRFEKHRPMNDIEEGGNYLVEYDSTTYWAELRHDLIL